jgi:hypothetical protein
MCSCSICTSFTGRIPGDWSCPCLQCGFGNASIIYIYTAASVGFGKDLFVAKPDCCNNKVHTETRSLWMLSWICSAFPYGSNSWHTQTCTVLHATLCMPNTSALRVLSKHDHSRVLLAEALEGPTPIKRDTKLSKKSFDRKLNDPTQVGSRLDR